MLCFQNSKKATVESVSSSSSEEDSKAGIVNVVECQSVHNISQQEHHATDTSRAGVGVVNGV